MKILLQTKCSASGAWMDVAKFEMGFPAIEAARLLSKNDGCTWRTIDSRWLDEGKPLVHIFKAGEEQTDLVWAAIESGKLMIVRG